MDICDHQKKGCTWLPVQKLHYKGFGFFLANYFVLNIVLFEQEEKATLMICEKTILEFWI